MKQELLFSVLMANYNNAPFIAQAIESVLKQSYNNWELVIVDDASTDNFLETIKPFLKDKRIRLFRHENNLGCGATKRDCAEKASGEILGILDSDDALHKGALRIMAKAHLENPDCGLVYSTYYVCDENLQAQNIERHESRQQDKTTALWDPFVSHFDTFKKSAYNKTEGFSPGQKKAVDRDLHFKLEEITKLKFINKPLYYYRKHKAGISHTEQTFAYLVLAQYNAFKRRQKTKIPNLSNTAMFNRLLSAIKKLL